MRNLWLLVFGALAFAISSCSAECEQAADCALGSVCCRGGCVSALASCVECEVDADCGDGNQCDQNVCLAIVPRRDGGPPVNLPPTAVINGATTYALGTLALLNGLGSSDPEGAPLNYRWRFVALPATSTITLSDPTQSSISFFVGLEETYVVELVVNDGELDSEPAMINIEGRFPNVAPIANAGPDQVGDTNTPILLDGSGSSDAEGDPLTYEWTITSAPPGSMATLTTDTSSTATLTADLDGIYMIQLVVYDGRDLSRPDTVMVSVNFLSTGTTVFDPDNVWLMGRLDATDSASYVISQVQRSNDVTAGFPAEPTGWRALIRPTDGALIYRFEGILYEFRPETIRRTESGWAYPKDPITNDIPLTAFCEPVRSFFVTGEGDVIATCDDMNWMDQNGSPQTVCNRPTGMGYQGAILCANEYQNPQGTLFDLATLEHPVFAQRAQPDGGFLMATQTSTDGPAYSTLWEITPEGMITRHGNYAFQNFDGEYTPQLGSAALDGDGNLYRGMRELGPSRPNEDLIVFFSATFTTATTVYSESASANQFASPTLVTGP